MQSQLVHGMTGVRWLGAVAAALLCLACETPKLERDAVYPADWPDFAEIGADCAALDGTFANRGRHVDESGKAADAWLTDVLAAMPTPREAAPLTSLHACERVKLRIETHPSPVRSDSMLFRLVAVPSRRVSGSPEQWTDCADIHLPRGHGYPFAGGDILTYEAGMGACLPKRFFYYNPHPSGFGYVMGLMLEVAKGTDGSLVIKVWREGSPANPLAWARFPKAP